MDPVLQHLGDVTIQRLEKPKPKPEPPNEPEKTEEKTEGTSRDEHHTLKRNLEDLQDSTIKKFKISQSEISITGKPKSTPPLLPVFSDEEFSDYTESEFDSETELDNEIASLKKEAALKDDEEEEDESFLKELDEEDEEEEEEEEELSDSKPPSPPPPQIKTEVKVEADKSDGEDYEYDIKEKLKEMGEISFETVKKGEKPKKVESLNENEVTVMPAKKATDDEGNERKGAVSVAASMMRRNIREVMDETKLDESTLAAQRQEMERLQRVQEQQRIIREVQRQVAQERMQNKVLSLLQGGSLSKPGTSGTRIGSTVLVKLPNGETKPMTKIGKRPFELVKLQKGSSGSSQQPPVSLQQQQHQQLQQQLQQQQQHHLQQQQQKMRSLASLKRAPGQSQLTPSVSIAPVMKKPLPPHPHSDSDSEAEDYKHYYQKPPPKPKPREMVAPVPTIDLSSDDDCIVVSETEAEPSQDEPMEDDPANSGMHTNDDFNQPDEQGRVVINIGHPDNESDIYLAPQISRIIKPHQIGGVRFLYDNVVESINRFGNSTGFGCILAHSMGLGKTLQVVCFSDVFLRHTPAKTILCIMPINTLQNWMAEYNMWLPTADDAANSPLHAYGEVRPRTFNLHVLNDSHKNLTARAKVVHEWRTGGGVLLIGYEQYRLLSLRKQPKSRRKPHLIKPEDEFKNIKLFDEIYEALVQPGPDLVICDEGHRIKNSHASISQALKQMRTKRRVVLTGYPLQNNLMEYWCMVDFVRPNYLGNKTEFCNMFERPIQNGQCIDSTETDIKLMRYRAHVLHSLLVGFVQRRSHEVLQTALPQKEEHVLLLRMTTFQRKLYDTFMNEVVRSQAVPNPLKAFAVCCKIWNHPDVLYNFLKKRAGGDAVDIDLEEVAGNASTATDASGKPKKPPKKSSTPAKGRKGAKPAASVTPYNSTATNETETANQQQNPSQTKQEGCNVTPSQQSNSSNTFTQQFQNLSFQNNPQYSQNPPSFCNIKSESNQSCPLPSFSNQSQQNASSFSNQDYPEGQKPQDFPPNNQNYNYNEGTNFQNYQQQNYWGQQQGSNECFNNYRQQNFSQSSDLYNNACDNQWIKKEEDAEPPHPWIKTEGDTKPVISNNIITSPIKSENSQGETKPKIKIISDIKIGSPYPNLIKSEGKKINIISDIKLEVKKEEGDEKPKFFDSIKAEMKSNFPFSSTPHAFQTPAIPLPATVAPLNPPPLLTPSTPSEEEDIKVVPEMPPPGLKLDIKKEEAQDGIPYDWAIELLKDYIPGIIENSSKMEVLFCIIKESIALGDRLLLFSQSLITLDLIEQFLQTNTVPGETDKWAKNVNYYRLDGSTSALEREKLINEFNCNAKIHLFLVSTRAGSLGINLVGANRVVVLDASWNPCHDTQAVCRVYRYGQKKPCFVYRLVMDHCLEKKIYDRQINKQGMSDRVVDECNPDAHLTMKDVSTLCFDDSKEGEEKDWSHTKDNYIDLVMQKVLELYSTRLNKPPFQHESLLVDRKDKQLSQQEKRLAKKGYEREKQAARQPAYSVAGSRNHRPVASVRPMQQGGDRPSRWIPAEHWQRQGMTAQEMTLPLDVVIPTNQPDKSNIILKAGQKVLVLKSPKGVYMQLENGKIVAIKTAIKVKGKAEDDASKIMKPTFPPSMKPALGMPLAPPKRMVSPGMTKINMRSVRQPIPNLVSRLQGSPARKVPSAKTKPYQISSELIRASSQSKPDIMEAANFLGKDEMDPRTKAAFLKSKAELSQRLLGEDMLREKFPVRSDKPAGQKAAASKGESSQSSLPKGASRAKKRGKSSAIQQLEQSTSAIISETKLRIQDISDIAGSYQEDDKQQSASDTSSLTQLEADNLQDLENSEELEDLEAYQDDSPDPTPSTSSSSSMALPQDSKSDIPNQDYNYNGYYGYNMQPYPPPHQGYSGYPPQPPPYDYNYSQPQQPQYNYGIYPQAYPPQPQYPPPPQGPPYEYAPPPPPHQPVYNPYHTPFPQQYPPPPNPNPYPAGQPPPPPNYDYQYPAASQNQTPTPNQSYYPNT